ncbi:MAG: YdcF family protein [Butyrivibrio sp.]|nr:YdcF family protein [Butyrivibrio sp.]
MYNELSFRDIGNFIFKKDEPQKADLIVVPGAPIKELGIHAAELYKDGYSERILVSGNYYFTYESLYEEFKVFTGDGDNCLGEKTEASYLKKIMEENGVPGEAVCLEEKATSTFENAIFVSKMIREKECFKDVKHIILCCQAFHARRALMTFQCELKDIEITVCPVDTRGITINTWLDTQKGYNLVLGELSKCGEYFQGSEMYEKR